MSNKYVFKYEHNGQPLTFGIEAQDQKEAVSRLNSIKNNAEIMGRSVATVSIPNKGWFGKAVFFTVLGFFICFFTTGG